MASNRELWPVGVYDLDYPAFPCPSCRKGRLAPDKESYRKASLGESDRALRGRGYSPEDDYGRFTAILTCSNSHCGEVVTVAGDFQEHEVEDSSGRRTTATFNIPRYMHPGPPLMDIPAETPGPAAEAMKQAFSAFWGDVVQLQTVFGSAFERIMDGHGIPKKQGGDDLKLYARIDLFAEKYAGGSKETFDALRHVGNLGSHDGDVSREALLDSFEIYQEWLRNFYGNYPQRIKALTERLTTTRGKYE